MLIKSEILITMGMGWTVSSDKWKAPLVNSFLEFNSRKNYSTFENGTTVKTPNKGTEGVIQSVRFNGVCPYKAG